AIGSREQSPSCRRAAGPLTPLDALSRLIIDVLSTSGDSCRVGLVTLARRIEQGHSPTGGVALWFVRGNSPPAAASSSWPPSAGGRPRADSRTRSTRGPGQPTWAGQGPRPC